MNRNRCLHGSSQGLETTAGIPSMDNCILTGFIAALIVFALGCAERPESSDTDFPEAADVLKQTQQEMEETNLDISFSDVGDTAEFTSLMLLEPEALVELKEDAIQNAIIGFYETLAALGIDLSTPQAPASPLQGTPEISSTDLMFVHLHLARLFVLEAVRIIAIGGLGNDSIQGSDDDLFEVVLLERPIRYEFRLLDHGSVRADQFRQIQNSPSSAPKDLLAQFNASERQIIINAVRLLGAADIRVPAYPLVTDIDGQPIDELLPSIDRDIFKRDSLFHLEETLRLAAGTNPEIKSAVLEFIEAIGEDFVVEFVNDLSDWGFDFDKGELVGQIEELIQTAKE